MALVAPMPPDMHLQAIEQVVKSVQRIADHVTPTYPVDVTDCTAIRDLVLGQLPPGYRVEVYHRISEVKIEVRRPGTDRIFYEQTLEVTGVPATSIVKGLSLLQSRK